MSNSSISLQHTLKGHTRPIGALSISPDGSTLLSGGDDSRLIVWNLQTGECMQEILCRFHGAIGAICWISPESNEPSFVFGCADGSLHVYVREKYSTLFTSRMLLKGHKGAIEDVKFDHHHGRIASVGAGHPQVWKILKTSSKELLGEWQTLVPTSYQPKSFIPRNVDFCDDGASIVVYFLESHEVICYSIEPWSVKWVKELPTRIGNAVLCPDSKYLFVTNLVDGIDQYSFPTLERVQKFTHSIMKNVPLQVAVVQNASFIVSGGDDGTVRIFERRNGQLRTCLPHGEENELVQTVATSWDATGSTIVTASSGQGPGMIKVWVNNSFDIKAVQEEERFPPANTRSIQQIFLIIFLTSIIVSAANMYLPSISHLLFHHESYVRVLRFI